MLPGSLPSQRSHGFTLIELMVALSIITVLSILAFGVSAGVKKGNRPIKDIATLKQIGVSVHVYAGEHRGQFPTVSLPAAVKVLAIQMGYIQSDKDWSNDNATPKNSIFRNGADEQGIRRFFRSAYDDRPQPDPLTSFAFSSYIGLNPSADPAEYQASSSANTYQEIKRPSEKIYVVPGYFLSRYQERFSVATPNTPFRTANNPEEKGPFLALFVDGHTAMVDPEPKGLPLTQINHRWLLPKSE